MEFKVNDVVWAKMKGFPPWPARIVEPNSSVKAPKNKTGYEFLMFFGTSDVAWIQRKEITPHSKSILEDLKNKKKTKNFQQSIEELLMFLDGSLENKKQSLSKVKETVGRKKKLTKAVKIIKTAPNKLKILNNEKSRIKKIYKRKPANKKEQSPDNCLVSDQEDLGVSETPNCGLTYGFMGLSTFGRSILLKLVQSGIEVSLWDSRIDEVMKYVAKIKEIKRANSPAELIKNCDITLCCYEFEGEGEELNDVVHGEDNIIKGFDEAEKLGRNPGYVHLTYIDYKTSKLIYEATLAKKGMYLEAPVQGSCENVSNGDTIINVSGDRNLFAKCEKFFDLISDKCFFIGCDIGISSNTHMIFNGVIGAVNTAVAEMLALADKLSVNLYEKEVNELFYKMLQNNNIMERVEKMGIRTTEAVLPLKNVQKVMTLGLAEAEKVNQRMPMAAAANEVYKRARQLSYSDADVSAIYRVIKY